jgi:hypothetical protein
VYCRQGFFRIARSSRIDSAGRQADITRRIRTLSYEYTQRRCEWEIQPGDKTMFIKTTIALALVAAAISGSVAAPNVARK